MTTRHRLGAALSIVLVATAPTVARASGPGPEFRSTSPAHVPEGIFAAALAHRDRVGPLQQRRPPSPAARGQATGTGSSGGGRWRNALLFGLVGAGSGALAGTVAPCMSTTTITDRNGTTTTCDDRGATIGAYTLGFAGGMAIVGALFP